MAVLDQNNRMRVVLVFESGLAESLVCPMYVEMNDIWRGFLISDFKGGRSGDSESSS